MGVPAYEIRWYGAKGTVRAPRKFASDGEEVVFWALVQLIGREAFLYAVYWRDIPYTPGPENRSAEFVIPALDLVILVNSAFTHPNPDDDRLAEQLIGMLGYRVAWLWYEDIMPELGGDVMAALRKIPGLIGFGNAVMRKPSAAGRKRKFGQPPIEQAFVGFA